MAAAAAGQARAVEELAHQIKVLAVAAALHSQAMTPAQVAAAAQAAAAQRGKLASVAMVVRALPQQLPDHQ